MLLPYFVAFLTVALTGYTKRRNCIGDINDAYGNAAIAVRLRPEFELPRMLSDGLCASSLSP